MLSKTVSYVDIFIFVLGKVFGISLLLTKHLQTKNIDLTDVFENADSVLYIIQNIRKVRGFKTIFDEVKSKFNSLNIKIALPRKTNVQKSLQCTRKFF